MPFRRVTGATLLPSALAVILSIQTVPAEAAVGRANVRLVRLLDEVPDSLPSALGKVHDIRLRLERGNVLLLRQGGDFIALLPIERREGTVDSLQYFYYREGGPFLWFIPGPRERAVRMVADGGEIRVNSSRLIWGHGPGEGWIYFPEIPGNEGLKFSVVSGGSVDRVDPRDTKYWVELGAPGSSGF